MCDDLGVAMPPLIMVDACKKSGRGRGQGWGEGWGRGVEMLALSSGMEGGGKGACGTGVGVTVGSTPVSWVGGVVTMEEGPWHVG